MTKLIRFQEYKALAYRLFLAYLFYSLARLFFFIYNYKLLKIQSISEYLALNYHGLVFDTSAILYINILFILFSILPFGINTKKGYQTFLKTIYFTFNFIGFAVNFIDFIYYKFTYSRSTSAVMDIINNESNASSLFIRFISTYWHVYLLFFLSFIIWFFLYNKVKVTEQKNDRLIPYFSYSVVYFILIGLLVVAGLRGGDLKKSTRPVNNVDASRHVRLPQHADIVLNTTFSIIRTWNTNSFKKINLVSQHDIQTYIKPIKQYHNNPLTKPNIVLIITESLGREYCGAFNKDYKIENYKSYTPFLDKLAQNSLIFTNAYANGCKSIHGMSSVIAGIPSFQDAFTSSPYPNQKIQSLVSTLKELDYDTSFFHGAANGSMGFLGFGNILGFDHYYGRTEFNDDSEYDGSWGIWDEPFMQFMRKELNKKNKPFFSTIFTVSSHEPFIPPAKYSNTFPKGNVPMHQVVGYTDFAFRKFFETAKKEPWFKNTIFIITADHCNQVYYPFYNQVINRQAVPILFYKPDGSLKGMNADFAQQIDIYPTILDMIGYQKPFRSWGRSLLSEKDIKPFAFNFNGNQYQFMQGNYICTFDGNNITGIFAKNDYSLEKNLLGKLPENEIKGHMISAKAFLQDYMQRIMDRKMYVN